VEWWGAIRTQRNNELCMRIPFHFSLSVVLSPPPPLLRPFFSPQCRRPTPPAQPDAHMASTLARRASTALGRSLSTTAQLSAGDHHPANPSHPPALLLRDFIARSLATYFASAAPLGSGAGLPPMPSMAGQADYTRAVAALYAAQPPGSWLTPSELFSPHYGRAVAAFIVGHHAANSVTGSPLHIIEVGSGRGTLARDVLDALKANRSGGGKSDSERGGSLYGRTRYATLDVSPGLAQAARTTVRAAGHGPGVFRQALGDACEAGGWAAAAGALLVGDDEARPGAARPATPPPPATPYILACEVLDNLPHDRVERVGGGGGGGGGAWAQAMVRWGGPGSPAPLEELHPLADPVVAACLAAALEGEGGAAAPPPPPPPPFLARLGDWVVGEAPPPWSLPLPTHPSRAGCLFLPTGAARFLSAVGAAFPNHTLLALDFDALPSMVRGGGLAAWHGAAGSSSSTCWGAPLVSGPPTPGAPAVDYPHILAVNPPGSADIFFPSDFALLARLARQVAAAGKGPPAVSTLVMKSADFMRRHAPDLAATATASGWNPLVDDFANTAALVVERRGVGNVENKT